MFQKKKFLSLIVLLSMILSLFVPLGHKVEAKSMDNMQTFSLPMLVEEDELSEDLFDLSSGDSNVVVKEFNFKGDTVKVYFNTNIKYPIHGRIPIVIKLEYENEDTLNWNTEYQMILKEGDNEIILEHEDIETHEDRKKVYLLGLFPDTIEPGNYEISLGVYDSNDYGDNSTEIEAEKPIEPIEESEDIIEDIEIPISLNISTGETPDDLEEAEGPIEEPAEEPTDGPAEEPTEEPAEEPTDGPAEEPTEEPKEELEIPEESMEEIENNLEEDSSNASFETEFIPVRLSYEEILKEDEIILDKDEICFYLEDSGIGGKAEAEIVDSDGNVVYTTTERFEDRNYLEERSYYIDNFYNIDYTVYSGNIILYKCGEVSTGTYTFKLKLGNEEVYTKEIQGVNKYPMVNSISADKYVLAGDKKFNIEVSGEYLNRKDDIKLELVDDKGETIANLIESHYNYYGNDGYSRIIYTMEMEQGEELRNNEDYIVNVEYTGTENFQMKADYVTIRTATEPKAASVDTSHANIGILYIEGVNFSEKDQYVAEIQQQETLIGEFEAEFIDSKTLSIKLGQPLALGDYNICVYKLQNEGWKSHIGNMYFDYNSDTFAPDLPTGDSVLNFIQPHYIPEDAVSFNVEVNAYNLDSTGRENAELQIVDKNDNLISSSKNYSISYDSDSSTYIDFNMNLGGKLNPLIEYYYVFRWNNKEIKTVENERLQVKVINTPKMNNFELMGAVVDSESDDFTYKYPLNEISKDLNFKLSGINIKDKDKLNVYMKDSNDAKVTSLKSLSDPKIKEIYQEYSGSLEINRDIEAGDYKIIIEYNNKLVDCVEIEISDEVYADNIYIERTISSVDKFMKVELYRPFNIDKDKIDIQIYNLLGNRLDTKIISTEEIRNKNNNSLQKIEVKLKINDNLTDGYYWVGVYHNGMDLMEDHDYYSKQIHATGKPFIGGRTWLREFQNEKIFMNLTTFAETKNIEPSDGYKGYFYLNKDRQYSNNLEYVGTVDLSIGEKDGDMGIIFPSEKFIDYPIGEYIAFIEDPNGEMMGRTYFSIWERWGGFIPEEPKKEPIFAINFSSNYVSNRNVILNIDAKDYSLIKIANSEEKLETAEAIAVKPQMNWTLTEGDGEKTVYVQFFDTEGNSSEILSQTVILDATAPKLLEASINGEDDSEIEGLVIGNDIRIDAKTNEKEKVYAVFYKDGKEVRKESLRYDMLEEEVHSYGDWIQLEEEIDKIVIYAEDKAGNKSNSKVFDIKMGRAVQLSGNLYKGNKYESEDVAYHDIYLYRNVDGNYQWYKWTSTDRYGYYEFKSIPAGYYKIISKGPKGYRDIEEEIFVYEDIDGKDIYFQTISDGLGDLTVLVKDIEGKPVEGASISVYGYEANISENKFTDSDGKVIFNDIPVGANMDYDVSLYINGYYNNQTVVLTESKEIEFTMPSMKTLSGKVTFKGDTPVKGAEIRLVGGNQYYYATTNENGEYSMAVDTGRDYTLSISHPFYTAMEQKINKETTKYDINVYAKPKVYGTLKNTAGEPLANLDIYASGNNDWQRVKTAADGSYELRLGYGDYSISHGWVEGYMSKYENIGIGEDVLGSGNYELDIVLEPLGYNNSFKGEGNNVKADISTTQRGKTVNIAVNYKNNGYSTVDSGTVKVELPKGIEYKAGNIEKSFKNLKRGEKGQLLLTVEVSDNFEGNKIIIPAKIEMGEEEYAIGFAEIDIIDITLTAPELVSNGSFKVYGEATPGSNISIIDKTNNKVLAITKTRGRWYTADIEALADGEYEIFARAEKDGNIAISQTVKVEVDSINGITVENIEVETSGGQKVGINPEIGVPAFTAWAGINLDGMDIKISVELSKDIDSAKFIFAGEEYEAYYENGSWKATLSDWSATGTQQIIMEITTGDKTVRLIVGEVIILIDPSGYVYDDFTGEPIKGATVTCEVWNEASNRWEICDTALYGQVNPQITDEEGKYGWMVPEGIYRVRVDMDGYESRIVGDDHSIIIPPPRTDVNIGLLSLDKEYDDIVKTGFYVNRILGNQFIDIYNLLNDETKYMETMTETGLNNVFFVHQNGKGNYLNEILDHGLGSLRLLTDEDLAQSYKEVGTGIKLKPKLGFRLISANAESGKIILKFDGVGEEPKVEDFEVKLGEETVEIDSIEWIGETKKAVLNIPVPETEEKVVGYTVIYKETQEKYVELVIN